MENIYLKNPNNIHIYEYKFFDIYILNSNIIYNTFTK